MDAFFYSYIMVVPFGMIMISTRLFKALPSALLLSATGFVPPNPRKVNKSLLRPSLASALMIDCARWILNVI